MIRRVDRTTIEVDEDAAACWRDRRPARLVDQAAELGNLVPAGVPRADLGCGPGQHLGVLGAPVVALDAAYAMVALARDAAPDAWCAQCDLEQLPLRPGTLGGAWARASYHHLRATRVPWALMELHRAMKVGGPFRAAFQFGEGDRRVDDGDFPGRFFSHWTPAALTDVAVGAGFDVDACTHDGDEWVILDARRAHTLPDFVDAGMRLLVCGLNPSVYAADAGVGFARPGNRFWPAAIAAGLVTRDRDPRHALSLHRIGMTDLVKRATPKADALAKDEYVVGAARVESLVRWLRPGAICFVGLAGYRAAVERGATAGEIAGGFGGVPAYLMPNPSGVNAHVTVDDIAEHLRAALAFAKGGPYDS